MDRHGQDDPLGSAYEVLLGTEAVPFDGRGLRLEFGKHGRRKASGSFYTPSSLIDFTLDRALEPMLDVRLAGHRASDAVEILLETSVLDPAVGGGRFLVAAARRISARIERLVGEKRLAEVLRRCVHGIDIDPMAAEICRVQLWLAAADPTLEPLSFRANIHVGNALLGATRSEVARGIPDDAYRLRPGDDARACAALRSRNRIERRLLRAEVPPPNPGLAADVWCSAFFANKSPDRPEAPTTADLHWERLLAPAVQDHLDRIRRSERFLHPDLAFGNIFARGGFDVITGNPPFLNQLESTTSLHPARAALLRCLSRNVIKGYADSAAAFLERCSSWLASHGRLALIQPQSTLVARDSAPIRSSVLRRCTIRELWVARERIFGSASVHVCLPVLERCDDRMGTVARFIGAGFRHLPDVEIDRELLAESGTWAPLVASAAGLPAIPAFAGHATLATLADATADFRDQYYGLDGFLVEDAEVAPADRTPTRFPPLVTTGLIDLAECRWGTVPTRVLKRKWSAPRIDRQRMARDGMLESWIAARSRPKILLATQTRILEVLVDPAGTLVPGLPLITVVPHRLDDLWKVAAALASPVATAVAFCRHAGAALTVDAIKMSAAQVMQLPIPCESDRWERAAHDLRLAHAATTVAGRAAALQSFGREMARAYGMAESLAAEVEGWWTARRCVVDRTRDRSGTSGEIPLVETAAIAGG